MVIFVEQESREGRNKRLCQTGPKAPKKTGFFSLLKINLFLFAIVPALQVLKYISEAPVRWSEGFKSLNPNSSVSEMLNFFIFFLLEKLKVTVSKLVPLL